MELNLTLVKMQIAYGFGAGAAPSVLSLGAAAAMSKYIDKIEPKLRRSKEGWMSWDGERLRVALPLAGAVAAASALSRGSALVEADDVVCGIRYLEGDQPATSFTRLCDDNG